MRNKNNTILVVVVLLSYFIGTYHGSHEAQRDAYENGYQQGRADMEYVQRWVFIPIDILTILCHTKDMNKTKLSTSYLQSIMAEQLASERREREAARRARESGAVFTNWVISDRDWVILPIDESRYDRL